MAILSTILAPTDAALGKAVVSNPAVPAPVREGLNQESGLNDGICVPVLLLLLALIAPTEQHAGTATLAITLMLEEIGIGLLVAFVLTSLTIRLLKISYLNGWQLPLWRQLTMPGWPCSALHWPRLSVAAALSPPLSAASLSATASASTSTPIWTAAKATATCSPW